MKKICKCILLPTDEATHIQMDHLGRLSWSSVKQTQSPLAFGDTVSQHLYFTSDDEIKEGDWVYDIIEKTISQCNKEQVEYFNTVRTGKNTGHLRKKIIATTDTSLTTIGDCNECGNERQVQIPLAGYEEYVKCSHELLPQIPESFIKAFMKTEGKIDEVLVEMAVNYICLCDHCDCEPFDIDCVSVRTSSYTPKLREDGTVIVHQAKKYSRQEIENAINSIPEDMVRGIVSNWAKAHLLID